MATLVVAWLRKTTHHLAGILGSASHNVSITAGAESALASSAPTTTAVAAAAAAVANWAIDAQTVVAVAAEDVVKAATAVNTAAEVAATAASCAAAATAANTAAEVAVTSASCAAAAQATQAAAMASSCLSSCFSHYTSLFIQHIQRDILLISSLLTTLYSSLESPMAPFVELDIYYALMMSSFAFAALGFHYFFFFTLPHGRYAGGQHSIIEEVSTTMITTTTRLTTSSTNNTTSSTTTTTTTTTAPAGPTQDGPRDTNTTTRFTTTTTTTTTTPSAAVRSITDRDTSPTTENEIHDQLEIATDQSHQQLHQPQITTIHESTTCTGPNIDSTSTPQLLVSIQPIPTDDSSHVNASTIANSSPIHSNSSPLPPPSSSSPSSSSSEISSVHNTSPSTTSTEISTTTETFAYVRSRTTVEEPQDILFELMFGAGTNDILLQDVLRAPTVRKDLAWFVSSIPALLMFLLVLFSSTSPRFFLNEWPLSDTQIALHSSSTSSSPETHSPSETFYSTALYYYHHHHYYHHHYHHHHHHHHHHFYYNYKSNQKQRPLQQQQHQQQLLNLQHVKSSYHFDLIDDHPPDHDIDDGEYIDKNHDTFIPRYFPAYANYLRGDPIAYFILFAAYVIHHCNRTFVDVVAIYLRIRIDTRHGIQPDRVAFLRMALAFLGNYIHAYLIARGLTRFDNPLPSQWSCHPIFLLGISLWLIGWIINVYSDWILRNLRKPGETCYRIPYGGLFRYVSCPNYFGELLEWCGFMLAARCSPSTMLYFFWMISYLIPRALSHHTWYIEQFQAYRQLKRKACIPFLI